VKGRNIGGDGGAFTARSAAVAAVASDATATDMIPSLFIGILAPELSVQM
jgi:hypothetical protein